MFWLTEKPINRNRYKPNRREPASTRKGWNRRPTRTGTGGNRNRWEPEPVGTGNGPNCREPANQLTETGANRYRCKPVRTGNCLEPEPLQPAVPWPLGCKGPGIQGLLPHRGKILCIFNKHLLYMGHLGPWGFPHSQWLRTRALGVEILPMAADRGPGGSPIPHGCGPVPWGFPNSQWLWTGALGVPPFPMAPRGHFA